MPLHKTSTAGRGDTSECDSDQSAKLHIIGCRVIANTPRRLRRQRVRAGRGQRRITNERAEQQYAGGKHQQCRGQPKCIANSPLRLAIRGGTKRDRNRGDHNKRDEGISNLKPCLPKCAGQRSTERVRHQKVRADEREHCKN